MSSWTKQIAGLAIVVFAASAAYSDVMIVRAVGPSAGRFVAGRTLPNSARIVLQANDQLVLLDTSGTRSLRGPGSFFAGSTAVVTASLSDLAANRTERRARVGAVRNVNVDGIARRPNIWFVDTSASGATCIIDPRAVTLWRSDSEVAGSSIVDAGPGLNAKLGWIKGQSSQPWPAAIQIATGRDYHITGVGTPGQGTTIRFQIVAKEPTDLEQLASALLANHCQSQIDVMIATSAK